jgi:hypothetical protein
MLFPYGWPARLQTTVPPGEAFVHLAAGDAGIVAASARAVEVWSAGQQRVRLGRAGPPPGAAGAHAAAAWCPELGRLAVLVGGAAGAGGGRGR